MARTRVAVADRPPVRRAVWALLAVLAVGALAIFLARRETSARPPSSIAVLPFVDLSPQKNQECFSDGVTEEILSALTSIDGLRVAGRRESSGLIRSLAA